MNRPTPSARFHRAAADAPLRRSGFVGALLVGALHVGALHVGVASAQEPAPPPALDDTELEAAWQQVLGSRPDHVERAVLTTRSSEPPPVPLPSPSAELGTGWQHEIAIGGRQFSRTGFEESPGDVERRAYEFGWSATVGAPESQWRFEYGFESHVYRFRDASGLLPGTDQPVENLLHHHLGVAKRFAISPSWQGSLSAGLNFGLEGGADIGDALTWSALAEADWRLRDDFALSFGVLARDRLEDDPYFVPLIGFDWQIDASTRLLVDGHGVDLSRSIGRDTRLYVAGRYEDRQFRLDDSGPNPNGSMEERSFQAIVGLDLPAGIAEGSLSRSRVDVFAGVVLDRELQFRTSDVAVGGDDVDPAAVFGVRLRLGL